MNMYRGNTRWHINMMEDSMHRPEWCNNSPGWQAKAYDALNCNTHLSRHATGESSKLNRIGEYSSAAARAAE
jgi:hypothetical protein